MATKKSVVETIDVIELKQGTLKLNILGTTPIILNRLPEKAKRELFYPGKKKTRADKESKLKHDPWEEFRDSPYLDQSADGPTRIQGLSTWFKQSIRQVAIDTPGAATKAGLGRLMHVRGERIPIYGQPFLRCDVVIQAGMSRAPDIRTRCCIPQWATSIEIDFAMPHLSAKAIAALAARAGVFVGVGDWRAQKGSGNFGSFEIVDADDARLPPIMAHGRASQDAALQNPEIMDRDSRELLDWMIEEAASRGQIIPGAPVSFAEAAE